jgi:hypothetical protein
MNNGLGWASGRKRGSVFPLGLVAMLLLRHTDLAMLLPPLIVGMLRARVTLDSRSAGSD